MLSIFIIRELQVKMMSRYHYTPSRMAKSKKLTIPITGENTKKPFSDHNNKDILWTALCK